MNSACILCIGNNVSWHKRAAKERLVQPHLYHPAPLRLLEELKIFIGSVLISENLCYIHGHSGTTGGEKKEKRTPAPQAKGICVFFVLLCHPEHGGVNNGARKTHRQHLLLVAPMQDWEDLLCCHVLWRRAGLGVWLACRPVHGGPSTALGTQFLRARDDVESGVSVVPHFTEMFWSLCSHPAPQL